MISPLRKVKIGFLSKFLGIFEPHGLLLDGVMKFLPRHQFIVYALPIARTDYKPLSPSVREAVDVVVEISLSREHALRILTVLELDILIFADTMSEPMTHFLAHSRLAVLQMAFWGNPITSASAHIDYFISADCLEHPYRTRIPLQDEPYAEQVILLPGQGIWYSPPESIPVTLQKANFSMILEPDRNYTRSDFDFQEDWFIYFVPQSVFKIHPYFDQVLAEIIRLQPRGHLVVTGGRKQRWTDVYMTRLLKTFSKHNISSRLHMIERVSSEKFLALLTIANVMLHPFPFDGSRTSADSLIAGLVYVTLPTEYLRGRMGTSFYRTMNLPQLVAKNMSDYVQIAVRLGDDAAFYQEMPGLIQERIHLIWEDMETVYGWIEFLSVVSGLKRPSWEGFLLYNQHHFHQSDLIKVENEVEKKENDDDDDDDHIQYQDQQLPLVTLVQTNRNNDNNDNKNNNNIHISNHNNNLHSHNNHHNNTHMTLDTLTFLQRETAKRDERALNRLLFDKSYGPEVWLLEYEDDVDVDYDDKSIHEKCSSGSNINSSSGTSSGSNSNNNGNSNNSGNNRNRIGVARLETHLTRTQIPRIFTNWKRPITSRMSHTESGDPRHASDGSVSVSRRVDTMIYSVSSCMNNHMNQYNATTTNNNDSNDISECKCYHQYYTAPYGYHDNRHHHHHHHDQNTVINTYPSTVNNNSAKTTLDSNHDIPYNDSDMQQKNAAADDDDDIVMGVKPSIISSTIPPMNNNNNHTNNNNIIQSMSDSTSAATAAATAINTYNTSDTNPNSPLKSTNIWMNEDRLLHPLLLTTRELILQGGHFDEAIKIMEQFAITYSTYCHDNIQFLIDYGSLQILRGEYMMAYKACKRAVELAEEDAPLAYSCVGVATMYLGKKEECVDASYMAYKLMALITTAASASSSLSSSSSSLSSSSSSLSLSSSSSSSSSLSSQSSTNLPIVINKYPSMTFGISLEAIEFNLISAYKVFKLYSECVNTALSLMSLPPVEQGGGYVLMFAMVNWTTPRLADLHDLERRLQLENKLYFSSSSSSSSSASSSSSSSSTTVSASSSSSIFVNEIQRIQSRYAHILNPTVDSLTEVLPLAVKDKLLHDLISIVRLSEPHTTTTSATSATAASAAAAIRNSGSNNNNDILSHNQDNIMSSIITVAVDDNDKTVNMAHNIAITNNPSSPPSSMTTTTTASTSDTAGATIAAIAATIHPRQSSEVCRIQELSYLATSSTGGDKSLVREEYIHSGIVLLGQYYIPHDNNPVIIRDINQALINNLNNPLISEIILFNEIEYEFPSSSSSSSRKPVMTAGSHTLHESVSGSTRGESDTSTVGATKRSTTATTTTTTTIPGSMISFPNVWKIKQVVIHRRILFQDAFQYANQHLVGRTVILANADIYFDDTLAYLVADATGVSVDLHNQVLALLKWSDRGNALSLHLRTDSQDAWIFQPPLHSNVLELSNFHMGIARCDNRLVKIFELSGHRVINPAFAIHAIELHSATRVGVIYGTKGAAQGETNDLFLSDQHLF